MQKEISSDPLRSCSAHGKWAPGPVFVPLLVFPFLSLIGSAGATYKIIDCFRWNGKLDKTSSAAGNDQQKHHKVVCIHQPVCSQSMSCTAEEPSSSFALDSLSGTAML